MIISQIDVIGVSEWEIVHEATNFEKLFFNYNCFSRLSVVKFHISVTLNVTYFSGILINDSKCASIQKRFSLHVIFIIDFFHNFVQLEDRFAIP